jgi:hypothetical protein
MPMAKSLQNAKRRVLRVLSKVPPRTVVTFGALGLSRYVDFTEPTLLAGLRVLYFSVVAFVSFVYLFCYFRIKSNPDGARQITVHQSDLVAPTFSDDPDVEDVKLHVSVSDYDLRKLREKVQALGTQASVSGALHLYMGLTLPILIQSCTIPMDLMSCSFFELYVRGKDPKIHRQLKRPWKKEKGKLMDMLQKSIKDAGRLADGASFSDISNKPKVNAKKAGTKKTKKK